MKRGGMQGGLVATSIWARAWTIGFDCGSCSFHVWRLQHTQTTTRTDDETKEGATQATACIYPLEASALTPTLVNPSHTFQWYQHDERRQARLLRRRRQQNDMAKLRFHNLRPAVASR